MAEQTNVPVIPADRARARKVARSFIGFADHWVLVFSILWGIVMILPFFAPVFMRLGWTGPAEAVYFIYSFLCHQMAQRCFFLFGPQPMYNAAQLPIKFTGDMATDMLTVRAFDGNSAMGWKVAWSDRMVYMYGALWFVGMVFGVIRHRRDVRPLKLTYSLLLLLPMAIDGASHWLSDGMSGLAAGFRYDNQWLANLTGNALPHWFYYGDAFGSFNSWMRLFTGLCFGIAVVWFTFPYIDQTMRETAQVLRGKLIRAEQRDVQTA